MVIWQYFRKTKGPLKYKLSIQCVLGLNSTDKVVNELILQRDENCLWFNFILLLKSDYLVTSDSRIEVENSEYKS